MKQTSWQGRISSIVHREEDENFELHDVAPGRPFTGGDVLVIVHPGDASAESGIETELEAMTSRVASWDGEVVVLHRFSSAYMNPESRYAQLENFHCHAWFDAVNAVCALPSTRQIYGDQLDDASKLLMREFGNARSIMVTGLWADPDSGCAEHIWRRLKEAGVTAELDKNSPKAFSRSDPQPEM